MAFWGESPQGRMMRWISATGTLAIFCGRVGQGEELRRHQVHPLVGALCGKDHRHQECVSILVVQRDRRLGVKALERLGDMGAPFRGGR